MRMRHDRLRPFAVSGRWTLVAIILAFAIYTGLSLLLSSRTGDRSQNRAQVLQVAARQRTLAERYAKEILLARTGAPSAATVVAHDLDQSARAMLDGGLAPALAGDDDQASLAPLQGTVLRLQLRQEQSLIHDLIATGNAVLSGDTKPVRLTGGERYPRTMPPVLRLTALTGLTSNVSLNVARSIGESSDRSLSSLISLQRLLAAVGLAVFGLLSWALVSSTRRRSAHFRSLVASTTDLVLVFTDGHCRYASNSVLGMIGCHESTVLGDGIFEFVHSDDRAGLLHALRHGGQTTIAFQLSHLEHGWRELEANLTDLRDDRHVRGIVLNARDVTERKLADAERERLFEQEKVTNERLRELDRLKDEFVALVSHEVRTPLTSINGYLEMLSDGQLTAEQREFTNIIGRNSDRLLRLINDLLFIAQIEDGGLTVERDQIDLGPILAQSLIAAAPSAAAGEVELLGDDSLPLPITGDPGRLAQLFDNLVSNAIKFTPAGGAVEVTAGMQTDIVWIDVRDTGIGISEVEQEQLFNKFFRTRAVTKSSIQGTGLGLTISRAIVHAHGGEIRLESEEGRGSVFRVELPISTAPASARPYASRAGSPSAG
jgi:PAS domain S-box-containing protein